MTGRALSNVEAWRRNMDARVDAAQETLLTLQKIRELVDGFGRLTITGEAKKGGDKVTMNLSGNSAAERVIALEVVDTLLAVAITARNEVDEEIEDALKGTPWEVGT